MFESELNEILRRILNGEAISSIAEDFQIAEINILISASREAKRIAARNRLSSSTGPLVTRANLLANKDVLMRYIDQVPEPVLTQRSTKLLVERFGVNFNTKLLNIAQKSAQDLSKVLLRDGVGLGTIRNIQEYIKFKGIKGPLVSEKSMQFTDLTRRASASVKSLDPRKTKILERVLNGESMAAIARELEMSPQVVLKHARNDAKVIAFQIGLSAPFVTKTNLLSHAEELRNHLTLLDYTTLDSRSRNSLSAFWEKTYNRKFNPKNVEDIKQLAQLSPEELLKESGIGPESLKNIQKWLHTKLFNPVLSKKLWKITAKLLKTLGKASGPMMYGVAAFDIATSDDKPKATAKNAGGISGAAGGGTAGVLLCSVGGPLPAFLCGLGGSIGGGLSGEFVAEKFWELFPSESVTYSVPPGISWSPLEAISFSSGFTSDTWLRAKNLFATPDALVTANFQEILAAMVMQQDPNNLFNLDTTALNYDPLGLKAALHRSLRSNFPDPQYRANTWSELIDAGILGDGAEATHGYVMAETEEASKLEKEINRKTAAHQEVSPQEYEQLSALTQSHILPALGLLMDQVTKIDISDYENNPEVVENYEELQRLKRDGASLSAMQEQAEKLKDNMLDISHKRKTADQYMQTLGHFGDFAKELGKLTGNIFLQKTAAIIPAIVTGGKTILSIIGMAAPMGPFGIIFALGASVLNIINTLGGGNAQEEAMKQIMATLKQIAEMLAQVHKDMLANFAEVKDLLHEIVFMEMVTYELIDHISEWNKGSFKDTLSKLAIIGTTLEAEAQKSQHREKFQFITQFLNELMRYRNAVDSDRSKYVDLRSFMRAQLVEPTGTAHLQVLTGTNCPSPQDHAALSAYIDDLSSHFHLGTMTQIYLQLGLQYANYSPEMMKSYIATILQNNTNYKVLHLSSSHLIGRHYKDQKTLFGLDAEITSFLSSPVLDKVSPNILITTIFVGAKWQLIIFDKSLKQVFLFIPDNPPELMKKTWEIVQNSVTNITSNFALQLKPFSLNISPEYYGPVVIEVIRRLAAVKPYDDIWEYSDEKLSLLRDEQTKFFNPPKELLDTRQAMLMNPANPIISQLLTLHLLEMYYHLYPEISDGKYHEGLVIPKEGIDDIGSAVRIADELYHFSQAFNNKELFERLFTQYKDAIHKLQEGLGVYRQKNAEGAAFKDVILKVHQALVTQYTDRYLMQQFKDDDINIGIYGNWDTHLEPNGGFVLKCPRHFDVGGFTNGQKAQITNYKNWYCNAYSDNNRRRQHTANLSLFSTRPYYESIFPPFMISSSKNLTILPMYDSIGELTPELMSQLQSLNKGKIAVSNAVNGNNQFVISICFVKDYNPGNAPTACVEYVTNYRENDNETKFYRETEGAWWWWVGGTIPSKERFPETHFSECVSRIRKGWCRKEKGRVGRDPSDPRINKQGAMHLPASSFSIQRKLTDSEMSELQKLLDDDLADKRTEFYQQLANTIDTFPEFIDFKLARKELVKFIEFVLPSTMHQSNNVLSFLLGSEDTVYDDKTLLAYLKNPASATTADYITTRFIANEKLDIASHTIVSRLPFLMQNLESPSTAFLLNVLKIQEELLPYATFVNQSLLEQKVWNNKMAIFYQDLTVYYRGMLACYMRNNPNQCDPDLVTRLEQYLPTFDKSFQQLDNTNQAFQSGKISYLDAQQKFSETLKLFLPLLPSGPSTISTKVANLLSNEPFGEQNSVRMTQLPATSGAASIADASWVGLVNPTVKLVSSTATSLFARTYSLVASIYTWTWSNINMDNYANSPDENKTTTSVSRTLPNPSRYTSDLNSQLLLGGWVLHWSSKLLPSHWQRRLNDEETLRLQSLQQRIQVFRMQTVSLADTSAIKFGFLSDKFTFIQLELDINNEDSLAAQIQYLLAKKPTQRLVTSSEITTWVNLTERIQKYLSQITDLNEQFAKLENEEQMFCEKHPNEKVVSTFHYNPTANKLRLTFAIQQDSIMQMLDKSSFSGNFFNERGKMSGLIDRREPTLLTLPLIGGYSSFWATQHSDQCQLLLPEISTSKTCTV